VTPLYLLLLPTNESDKRKDNQPVYRFALQCAICRAYQRAPRVRVSHSSRTPTKGQLAISSNVLSTNVAVSNSGPVFPVFGDSANVPGERSMPARASRYISTCGQEPLIGLLHAAFQGWITDWSWLLSGQVELPCIRLADFAGYILYCSFGLPHHAFPMSKNSARTLLRHNTVSEGRYANAQDIDPCGKWSTRTLGLLTTALVVTLSNNSPTWINC
jgi:hypothetical protein